MFYGIKFEKTLTAAHKPVSASALPAGLVELVQIRASQINGCGYCTDMHTKDAAHAGGTPQRINMVASPTTVQRRTQEPPSVDRCRILGGPHSFAGLGKFIRAAGEDGRVRGEPPRPAGP